MKTSRHGKEDRFKVGYLLRDATEISNSAWVDLMLTPDVVITIEGTQEGDEIEIFTGHTADKPKEGVKYGKTWKADMEVKLNVGRWLQVRLVKKSDLNNPVTAHLFARN